VGWLSKTHAITQKQEIAHNSKGMGVWLRSMDAGFGTNPVSLVAACQSIGA
jgi:hypothetical protein